MPRHRTQLQQPPIRSRLAPTTMAKPINLITSLLSTVIFLLYFLLQRLLIALFSPPPHPPTLLTGHKIAVLGVGHTGASAAAHCVSHNSDVTIFQSSNNIGRNLGARQLHLRATNPLDNVPLPPVGQLLAGVSKARGDSEGD